MRLTKWYPGVIHWSLLEPPSSTVHRLRGIQFSDCIKVFAEGFQTQSAPNVVARIRVAIWLEILIESIFVKHNRSNHEDQRRSTTLIFLTPVYINAAAETPKRTADA